MVRLIFFSSFIITQKTNATGMKTRSQSRKKPFFEEEKPSEGQPNKESSARQPTKKRLAKRKTPLLPKTESHSVSAVIPATIANPFASLPYAQDHLETLLSEHDVVFGGDTIACLYPDNSLFLRLISEKSTEIAKAASADDEDIISRDAQDIVKAIRDQAGRFLVFAGGGGTLSDVKDVEAVAKTSVQLRLALQNMEKNGPNFIATDTDNNKDQIPAKKKSKTRRKSRANKKTNKESVVAREKKREPQKSRPLTEEEIEEHIKNVMTPQKQQVRALLNLRPNDVEKAAKVITVPDWGPFSAANIQNQVRKDLVDSKELESGPSAILLPPLPSPEDFSPFDHPSTMPLAQAGPSTSPTSPGLLEHKVASLTRDLFGTSLEASPEDDSLRHPGKPSSKSTKATTGKHPYKTKKPSTKSKRKAKVVKPPAKSKRKLSVKANANSRAPGNSKNDAMATFQSCTDSFLSPIALSPGGQQQQCEIAMNTKPPSRAQQQQQDIPPHPPAILRVASSKSSFLWGGFSPSGEAAQSPLRHPDVLLNSTQPTEDHLSHCYQAPAPFLAGQGNGLELYDFLYNQKPTDYGLKDDNPGNDEEDAKAASRSTESGHDTMSSKPPADPIVQEGNGKPYALPAMGTTISQEISNAIGLGSNVGWGW